MYVALLVSAVIALLAALLWAATRTGRVAPAPAEAAANGFEATAEHWSLAASCGIGAWTWRPNDGTVEWDAAMHALFDVPAGQAPPDVDRFIELLSPADRDRVRTALSAVKDSSALLDSECTIARTNRTVTILATRSTADGGDDGRTIRVSGVCQDVTRRKELETRHEEHARLAQFFAAIGAALTEKTTLEVTLGTCATAMTHDLDVAVCRIWTVDDAGTMLELKASAGIDGDLERGPRRIPVEDFTNGMMGDHDSVGREALHGFGGYPLLVDDRLVGVLTMFSRTSLSPATIAALAIAAKQLALGIEHRRADVVTFVAHDFNNLLTAIGVCVDLLKSRLPTGSLERHYVEDIETAVTRAADLTRLLQVVSHGTPGQAR